MSEIFKKMSKTFEDLKGYILTLFANFILTMCFFVFKYYTNEKHYSPQILIALRGFFISFYSIIYICIYLNSIKKFDIKQIGSLLSRGFINGFGMLFVVTSLKYIRVSTCELFCRTGNLMSVFLGYFMLGEKITQYDIYGLISTFIGSVFILKPSFLFPDTGIGNEDQPIGVILVLCCALLAALGIVLTKKLMESFDEIFAVSCMGLTGCFCGTIFCQLGSVDMGSLQVYDLFGLGFSVFFEFLGIYLNFKALLYVPVSKIAPFYNSRLVYAVVFVYIFTGLIDIFDILGVSLIVATYCYISFEKLKLVKKGNENSKALVDTK